MVKATVARLWFWVLPVARKWIHAPIAVLRDKTTRPETCKPFMTIRGRIATFASRSFARIRFFLCGIPFQLKHMPLGVAGAGGLNPR